jgi:hypothetical protein
MRCTRLLSASAISLFLCLPSFSQEVVSARSGVVHFLEGAVSLDDQPLDRKAGVFPTMKEGSTLRTEKGRAEILLTPNVFLRMDENSAVRMLSSSLTDTRLEFLQGSIILDSIDAPGVPAIALTYKQSQIRFPKHGAFRLDSDTDVLRAYSGEAQVVPAGGKPVSVDNAHLYFFTLGLTDKFMDRSDDEFYDWAKDRHEAISSQNQLAQDALDSSQADTDPNATAPVPLYGNSPSYGNYPSYPSSPSYAVTDPTLWMTGGVFDPFMGLNGIPSFQTFVFIPVGRYWWSHRPDKDKTHWPGLSNTKSGGLNNTKSGWLAGSASTRPLPVRMPAGLRPGPVTPTRVFPTTIRPPGHISPGYMYSGHIYAGHTYAGHTAARPAPMPRFSSAPSGVHAIGHR